MLVVLLCVCAACSLVYPYNPQDGSRYGVTDALASYGSVKIDRWASETSDKAHYGGHWYSDKPPGMAVLALPAYGVLRAFDAVHPASGPWQPRWALWVLRLSTGGVAFAAMLLLIARGSDRLLPGTGALTAAAVGVGTFALGLAATSFAHLASGALAFAGFLLLVTARSRRERWLARVAGAGACLGAAVVFDELSAIAVAALAVYLVATTRSVRRLAAFCLGGAPAAAALGIYNQVAFGSPVHNAYDYGVGFNGQEHRHGLSGAGWPKLGYVEDMVTGRHGLLLTSPVIVVAGFGLLLLRRRYAAEALACVTIVVGFFVYSAGFFDPIGGRSPGPRYLGAAIPFAAVGLAPIVRRWPRATLALAVVSAAGAIADAVRWAWTTDTSTWLFVDMSPAVAGVLVAIPALAALALAAARD